MRSPRGRYRAFRSSRLTFEVLKERERARSRDSERERARPSCAYLAADQKDDASVMIPGDEGNGTVTGARRQKARAGTRDGRRQCVILCRVTRVTASRRRPLTRKSRSAANANKYPDAICINIVF